MLAFYGVASRFEYDPEKGSFRAFLRKVTFRLLCNKRGREAKFRGVPIEQVDPQSEEVASVWEQIWDDEQLRRAIAALRERYSINDERAPRLRRLSCTC